MGRVLGGGGCEEVVGEVGGVSVVGGGWCVELLWEEVGVKWLREVVGVK